MEIKFFKILLNNLYTKVVFAEIGVLQNSRFTKYQVDPVVKIFEK